MITLVQGQQSTSYPTDAATFKRALRRHVGGVAVVTAGLEHDRTGATVTSAIAFSVDPPTMIVNINLNSSSWPVIKRYQHFCINILDYHHQNVAERFAGRGGIIGAERYEGATWTRLITGASALVGGVAAIDCEVEESIERHSHAILLGRVKAIVIGDGSPLIYANGNYHDSTKI